MKSALMQYEGLPVFEGLLQPNIEAMLACLGAYTKQVPSGQYILLEEQAVNYVGLVLKGRVHMVKEGESGSKSIIIHIGEGGLFGESFGLFPSNLCAVSFQAVQDCLILFLPFHRVYHLCNPKCKYHNKLVQNISLLTAQKNAQLIEKISIMSQRSLRDKLLFYLQIQANHHGTTTFDLPFGRVELADFLGVDRSSLTRELGNMKKLGLIDFERNRFTLC